jgi:sodium transport system permease protein
VAATWALLSLGGPPLARLGLGGIALSQLLLVLAPTLAWLASRGVRLGAGLALRPVRRATLGGAVAGAGGFYLVALLEAGVLERVWPTPPALRESLRRLIVPPSGARPLVADLLGLALVPAVCEEALFRGALLGALARRGRAAAIVGAALVFALYHASPHRFVPVALLGLALGGVRVASGSLAPAIAFHATNNLAVIGLVRLGRESVPSLLTPAGAAGALAATVAIVFGYFLLARRTQPP